MARALSSLSLKMQTSHGSKLQKNSFKINIGNNFYMILEKADWKRRIILSTEGCEQKDRKISSVTNSTSQIPSVPDDFSKSNSAENSDSNNV